MKFATVIGVIIENCRQRGFFSQNGDNFPLSKREFQAALISTQQFIRHESESKPDSFRITTEYTGWSKKTAQSLWHHNFATVRHCFFRNILLKTT